MRKVKQHKQSLLTHLGYAIRDRRQDADMTQQQLATRSRLHRTYVTDIEGGRRNLSMLTYGKLVEALGCALSFPMLQVERTMGAVTAPALFGKNGALSQSSTLAHASSSFMQSLGHESRELDVKVNMSKLQFAVEAFGRMQSIYPVSEREIEIALGGESLINPFTEKPERVSIGTAIDEELATRVSCLLRPGQIEYSPMNKGANYIIRGGGANGQALTGPKLNSTYVLSGNLRSKNQP